MSPETTSFFLFAYFLVSLILLSPTIFAGNNRKLGILLTSLSVVGIVATIAITSTLQANSNFVVQLLNHLIDLSRDELVALLLGAAVALPTCLLWLKVGFKIPTFLPLFVTTMGLAGTLLFGLLLIGKEIISPYLPHPDTTLNVGGLGRLAPPEFAIEDYIDTRFLPIRVAVSPAGRVYVSGHLGIAAQEGAIVELVELDSGEVQERVVARMLNRPYGLLATNEHLYVSRSGQHTKWNDGVAEQISTGAVTRLTDLDNDGVMDHYHDIVKDLPGAKGPDFLHQNNGIAFGPDGALYVTTANESDGHPTSDASSGAILRATGEDYSQIDIFANGLRNPFGLAFNAKGELFATDNDSQTGLLGNLGDKLLRVQEGAFYGHPFAPDDVPGVSKPLLRSSFALGGLALAQSSDLPKKYRDSLFVVVYGEGRIMQIMENQDGSVQLVPFATIPGAVDIAISPNGHFYVGVYPDKIVRIRLKEAS